mgnify:CR=1 FL=1
MDRLVLLHPFGNTLLDIKYIHCHLVNPGIVEIFVTLPKHHCVLRSYQSEEVRAGHLLPPQASSPE